MEKVGEGAYGVVHKARVATDFKKNMDIPNEPRNPDSIALKMIKNFNPKIVETIMSELRILLKMNHKNVIKILNSAKIWNKVNKNGIEEK